jgi:hypothetical protein
MEAVGESKGDLSRHVADVPSYTKTDRLPVKYFLATDTAAIIDQAQLIYGDKLVHTPDEPKHPAAATRMQQLKIVLDWYLLSLCDQVVSVGDSQSTFSATAWFYSLRPEMFHMQSDWGLCRRGGSGFYRLHGSSRNKGGNFDAADPHLQQCFASDPIIRRFVPTNEEKLLAFYKEQGTPKTNEEVRNILENSSRSLTNIMDSLKRKYGLTDNATPHLFEDNELSIDAVRGQRIEVEGPAQTA